METFNYISAVLRRKDSLSGSDSSLSPRSDGPSHHTTSGTTIPTSTNRLNLIVDLVEPHTTETIAPPIKQVHHIRCAALNDDISLIEPDAKALLKADPMASIGFSSKETDVYRPQNKSSFMDFDFLDE